MWVTNFVTPFIDSVVYRETIREKVLNIPPNNTSPVTTFPKPTVDAVVYWRIVDMEKAYCKSISKSAMVNLVLTPFAHKLGRSELTFSARSPSCELLLRDLRCCYRSLGGVKVTGWNYGTLSRKGCAAGIDGITRNVAGHSQAAILLLAIANLPSTAAESKSWAQISTRRQRRPFSSRSSSKKRRLFCKRLNRRRQQKSSKAQSCS